MIAVDWVEALPGPYEGIGRIIQMRGAADTGTSTKRIRGVVTT